MDLQALWLQPNQSETLSRTIDYTYDALNRLTAADYDDDSYFHYTYDAVGNRLSETTGFGTTSYTYDDANRLTQAGAVSYTWDDNGNLLSDGVSTFTYDTANRLVQVSQAGVTYGYMYNGIGDRVQQSVEAVTTSYTLDLNAGLTQVLSDGTTTYLYGAGRIGEDDGTDWLYYLPDGLGSVRQLADESGSIGYAQNFAPYGEQAEGYGEETSNYGFTGEWQDATGLVYLRARYYAPGAGRFITKDLWSGNESLPNSQNRWSYAFDDPISNVDPSGYVPVKIWISAFIKPSHIIFPYTYYPIGSKLPALDTQALWNGDSRDFYRGGPRPSARVWHEVHFDTDYPNSVRTYQGTGQTVVTYNDKRANLILSKPGHADPPEAATIFMTKSAVIIRAIASAKNPLVAFAPPIDYEYFIFFNLRNGYVFIRGEHDRYPWHEVYISVANKPYRALNASPSGPTHKPWDLVLSTSFAWSKMIPELKETTRCVNTSIFLRLRKEMTIPQFIQ